PPRRRLRQRRLRRDARLPRGDAGAVARDGPDERPRRRLHDPRDAACPARDGRAGPRPADQLGRRSPRPPRQPLQRHQARRHSDGRGAARGAAQRRRPYPRDLHRARHGRHAVLLAAARERAPARRHRARGALRRAAAAARRRQRAADPAYESAGVTDTTRPRRPVANCTVPAARAYSVSSLPIPTPSPGWNFVPRWRTMISPPVTVWPANTLTPRRLAWLSRPLREEPSPFL